MKSILKIMLLLTIFLSLPLYASSKEDQWWSDYEHSGEKRLVHYVYNLSQSAIPNDQDTVLWFLLTGGKYGFAQRTATAEEQEMMISSLTNVSINLIKTHRENTLSIWDIIIKDCSEGRKRVQMIYEKIEYLKQGKKEISEKQVTPALPQEIDDLFKNIQKEINYRMEEGKNYKIAFKIFIESCKKEEIEPMIIHRKIEAMEQYFLEKIQKSEIRSDDSMRELYQYTKRDELNYKNRISKKPNYQEYKIKSGYYNQLPPLPPLEIEMSSDILKRYPTPDINAQIAEERRRYPL